MPPKRRAAQKSRAKAGGKKAKVAPPSAAEIEMKVKVEELKTADSGKMKSFIVDVHCSVAGAQVHNNYDCMLNQTNINQNNNKFYVIQLLSAGKSYYVFTKWGRVGELGQNATKQFSKEEDAIKEFKKKFSDKTKNNWDNRDAFAPVPGKYTIIEVERVTPEEIAEQDQRLANLDETDFGAMFGKFNPCTLDKDTQCLVQLILDTNMFEEQMANFNLDVQKMPLGQLSKLQIAKGFDVLEEIQAAVEQGQSSTILGELSSKFYTVIPHSFGRKLPPVMKSGEVVQKKRDMLLVLGDIELAQNLQKEKPTSKKELEAHPLDIKYSLLNCDLELVPKKSLEYKVIEKYTKATGSYQEFQNIWKVDRHDEGKRFSLHKSIKNRRLLWHGTNVAVVAAILKSGLRIMPHSGGRVGRGIYFASEHSKSAGYVGTTNDGIGIMFLNEVALGTEYHISKDDSSLRSAPKGYDCVIAKGGHEPDPSKDTILKLDGNDVTVPQGKPKEQKGFTNSSFWQSEYLVYKESQNRIRYLLQFKLH